MKLRSFVWLILAISMNSARAHATSPDEFKGTLLAEWRSVLNSIRTSSWEEKTETFTIDKEKLRNSADPADPNVYRRFSLATQRRVNTGTSCLFLQHEEAGTDRAILLFLGNTRYLAELRKTDEAQGWALRQIDEKPESATGVLGGVYKARESRCPWMLIGGLNLCEALGGTQWTLTRVESRNSAGAQSIRAYLTYRRDGQKDGSQESGFVEFDPKHQYRPVSYELNSASSESATTQTGTVEYEEGPNSISVPKQQMSHLEGYYTAGGAKQQLNSKTIETYSKVEYNGRISEEEFRLSHYGLPEPNGVSWPKPTPWYLWFFAIALALLGLAALFRWDVRRRRARLTPAS